MDEQRWLEVRRIFEAAVQLPEVRRTLFVEEACGGDEDLRSRVSRLLDADGRTSDLLDVPPGPLLPADDAEEPEPPRHVGPYRLLDVIGRGGMGVVYRAERADGSFERTVALKLVRGGFDSDDVLARFHAERRILANLEHPNVARLYDAGLAGDGRPYLVMELVDGEPIDRHCDRRRLDVRARIRLVRAVCDAVQYAHRNLVIHRDLKPSNILVDVEGSVRLLDFGIAKLTAPDPGAPEGDDGPATGTGRRPLTAEYASPEQIRGEPLTTASDVYSLGVVLYELLTGRRPFEGWVRSVAHALGTDASAAPAPPSRCVTAREPAGSARTPEGEGQAPGPEEIGRRRRTSAQGLRRSLSGDLDRILLKALARDPAERYRSVEALAEDLDRFLQGQPVRARPPSIPYRMRKFVSRNRFGTAAAALALLAIGAAGAVAARESREAAVEREVALGVSDFLEDLFRASDPRVLQVQDTTRMIDFLDASAERVRTELDDRPRTRARMLLVLGLTMNNIGRTDRAEPLLREAIEANLALHGERHADVAEARRLLGLLLVQQERFDEAIPMLRGALELQRTLSAERSWEVARLHEAVGRALLDAGRPDEASEHVEAALEIRREVLEPGDPVIASSINVLAALRSQLGDDAGAVPLLREAIETSERSPDAVPEDIAVQRMNLAMVHMRLGRWEEALDEARRGQRVLESSDAGWLVALSRARLAEAVGRVAVETRSDTLFAEADSLFRSGIALLRTLPESASVRFPLHDHASVLRAWGNLARAEATEREAIDLTARVVGDSAPETFGLRAVLAGIILESGRLQEADPLAREAYDFLAATLPVGRPARASAAATRARVLLALGRPEEAVALLEDEHAGTAEALGAAHPLAAAQRELLVEALEAVGRPEEARRLAPPDGG